MRSPYGLTQKDKTLINAKKSCGTKVDLRGNNLFAIPRVITENPLHFTLQYLELSYNDFNSIPSEVCLLSNLKELYIQYNNVNHIPDDLGKLTKLERLGLAHNKVARIPESFQRLTELQWLNLSGNQLTQVPEFVLYLKKLKSFWLICNPIENVPRDVYIQGLEVIRDYFNVKISYDKCVDNQSSGEETLSFLEDKEPVMKHINIQETDSMEDHTEQKKAKFSVKHSQIVAQLEHSQKKELELIGDLMEKLKTSQELRKMNIDFLQRQPVKRRSFKRSRRVSDLSLDSGIRDHSSRCLETSEYGSMFNVSCEDNDSTESIISLFNQPPHECSDNSDNDLSDVELLPTRKRHITCGDICVIIPECNLSGHFQSEFILEIIHNVSYEPPLKPREVLASEILMMEPHGAKFYKSDPAIISMPFDVKISSKDQILCWCSDTAMGEKPRWLPIDKSLYTVHTNHVEIQALHFSLFAVTAQNQYPCAQRLIKKGVGGCLHVDQVPGVEVNFPETSLLYDIEASIKVLYSDDPYDVDHGDPMAYALAAPVVELGPHGCQFDLSSKDHVTVRLPLPNGSDILQIYGERQLTFWYSSTLEGEPLNWIQFTPKTSSIDHDDNNFCSVYFSVEHFTFFRVLWDVLDAILYEAKLGASHYLPVFQFYVSCQALMSESEDGIRFGLCVSCSRFGKALEGIGNFPIAIGSHSPKMISTGPLSIRVISGLFEADTAAGQESLTHEETFTGRQIVAQFICRFKCANPPTFGSFGRVEIIQPAAGSSTNVFSFNLDKPRDSVHYQSSHAWDVHMLKELAALITISNQRDMGDEVWQDIANALRYTQAEITNISSSTDPMKELLANYKRRGGQPHEFITAMYSIGQYKTSPFNSRIVNKNILNHDNQESSTSNSQMCPCTNKRKRKMADVSVADVSEEKLNEISGKILGKWKDLGRSLKVKEIKLKEIELNYKQDGVKEQAYQMLLAWRDLYPDNYTLSVLYDALYKTGLGSVARQDCMIEMG